MSSWQFHWEQQIKMEFSRFFFRWNRKQTEWKINRIFMMAFDRKMWAKLVWDGLFDSSKMTKTINQWWQNDNSSKIEEVINNKSRFAHMVTGGRFFSVLLLLLLLSHTNKQKRNNQNHTTAYVQAWQWHRQYALISYFIF